jgi:hypothetical protein
MEHVVHLDPRPFGCPNQAACSGFSPRACPSKSLPSGAEVSQVRLSLDWRQQQIYVDTCSSLTSHSISALELLAVPLPIFGK